MSTTRHSRPYLLTEALIGEDSESLTLYNNNVWFNQWINMMAEHILPQMIDAAKKSSIKLDADTKVQIALFEKTPQGPLVWPDPVELAKDREFEVTHE